MGTGPVEFAVIAFPGNKFKGEIAPALGDLVNAGTIRILDLAFVMKDSEGNAVAVEVEDTDSAILQAFEPIGAERGGLLNADDLAAAAGALEPNSSAAVIIWEDLWATKLANALQRADAVVDRATRGPLRAGPGGGRLRRGEQGRRVGIAPHAKKGLCHHDASSRPRADADGRRHRSDRRNGGRRPPPSGAEVRAAGRGPGVRGPGRAATAPGRPGRPGRGSDDGRAPEAGPARTLPAS